MNDNRRGYRAIKRAITQLYPTETNGNVARQLHTLSGSAHLPLIAKKVPDETKKESRVKKYHRWIKNERISAETYFCPAWQKVFGSECSW